MLSEENIRKERDRLLERYNKSNASSRMGQEAERIILAQIDILDLILEEVSDV